MCAFPGGDELMHGTGVLSDCCYPIIAFSAGFAMMEAMLVLAAALQKFEFVAGTDQPFPEATPRITLRPAAVEVMLRTRLTSTAA